MIAAARHALLTDAELVRLTGELDLPHARARMEAHVVTLGLRVLGEARRSAPRHK